MKTNLQPEGQEESVKINVDGGLWDAVLAEDCDALYTPDLINSTSQLMEIDEPNRAYYVTDIAELLRSCSYLSITKQYNEVLEDDQVDGPDEDDLFNAWVRDQGGVIAATSTVIEEQRGRYLAQKYADPHADYERRIERSVAREDRDDAPDQAGDEDNTTHIL